MTCPNCGKEVNDGVKFCGGCGTTLNEVPTEQSIQQPTPVETPVVQSVPVEQPVVSPTPVVNPTTVVQPVQPKASLIEKIKGNKIVMIASIALAALLVIGLIFFVGSKIFGNKKGIEDPSYSTSFFLKNDDGKYALFNADGKKLSDFIYKKADNFFNGYALVINDKDQYGIIKPNGKMAVKFGKYPLIMEYNGLYVVPGSDEEFRYTLINPNGKTITKMKKLEISSLSYSVDSIIYVESDKTYDVYNYKGKKLVSFKKVNDDDKPKTNSDSGYATIYYNGETVVYNAVTGDYIAKIKEKDTHYCVNDASEDGKILTFNSCVGTFEKQDKVKYKVLVNKKEVKVDSKCEKTYLSSDVLVCDTEDDKYILTSKYKLGTKISSYSTAIMDRETFVTKEDDGYSFYKNGKMVKHLTGISSMNTGKATDYFILKSSNDYLYYYYDKDGNKVIDKGFKIAQSFDENGLAIVGDDYYTYYLIDKKGKKVGDTYYNISRLGETDKYKVSTKDSSNRKYGIINSKGKVVLDIKYYSIDSRLIYEDMYITAKTESDGEYELFNLKDLKKLGSYEDKPTLMDQYYYTTNNDKVEYYTYKGKKFYER